MEIGLGQYFTFYNYERLHQSLSYQTPAERGICAGGPFVVPLCMAYPFYGSGPWLECDDPNKDTPLFYFSPIHNF